METRLSKTPGLKTVTFDDIKVKPKEWDPIQDSRASTARTIRPLTGKTRPQTAVSQTTASSRPQTSLSRPDTAVEMDSDLRKLLRRQRQLERVSRPATAVPIPTSLKLFKEIPIQKLIDGVPLSPLVPSPILQTMPRNSMNLDPLLSEIAEQEQRRLDRCQAFLIANGQIRKQESAFLLFLNSIRAEWPLLSHLLMWIECISADYCVPWAECRFDKVQEILSLPEPLKKMKSLDDYILLMENQREVRMAIAKPGQRYHGRGRRTAAATKIQTSWRGYKQRRHYLDWKDTQKAGLQILKFWRRKMLRRWRLTMDEKRLELALEYMRETAVNFAQEWESKYQSSRTILMVNSLSLSPEARVEAQNDMEYLQTFSYARLLELMDSNVRIIFVTPKMSAESYKSFQKFIDFHFNLHELLASKRLVVIQVPKPSFIVKSMSLTASLLIQTHILKDIKNHIQGQVCYIESLAAGAEDARLCHRLKIPLFGNIDQVSQIALNRIETRRFIRDCNGSEMFGLVIPYNCKTLLFRSKLAQVIKEYVNYDRFVMKMNHQMNEKGLAYFDRSEYQFLGNDRADQLDKILYLVQPNLWNSPADYIEKFKIFGGVIEVVPNKDSEVKTPFVMLRVFPDGIVKVIGTGDHIGAKPFETTGIATPQQSYIKSDIKTLSYEFAYEMVKNGYYGVLTCEYLIWKKGEDLYEIKTLSVKPYYTQSYNFVQMIQFSARSWQLWDDSIEHIPSPEKQPKFPHLKKLVYFDHSNYDKMIPKQVNKYRVGLVLWGLQHETVPFLNNQSFQGLCTENHMYLHDDGTGAIIPIYAIQEKYPIIIINIQTSLEKAVLATLRDFVNLSRSLTAQIDHNFLDYAKQLVKFLQDNDADFVSSPCPNPYTATELELFVSKYVNDPSLFEQEIVEEKPKTVLQFSHETIKLLSLEIPSLTLKRDATYGKIQVIKPKMSTNRIPKGTAPEEYFKMIEKSNTTATTSATKQTVPTTKEETNKKTSIPQKTK